MTAVTPTLKWLSLYTGGWGVHEPPEVEWDGEGVSPPAMFNPFKLSVGNVAVIAAGTTGSVGGDLYPLGHLLFTVAPYTGVTMLDAYADGTGKAEHIGNGEFVANSSNQGEGCIFVQFAAKGSFILKVRYVSEDANYLTTVLGTALIVEVK